jgi:hypothetical protein
MTENCSQIEKRHIAFLGHEGVDARKRSGKDVSEAHSDSHLNNVAELTQVAGESYGFTEKELRLAYFSGWTHDLIRNPTEDDSVKDDEASAKEAKRILGELNDRKRFLTTEEERYAVEFAIKSHGKYPTWLSNPDTRNNFPEPLRDKLWLALFVADKIEANGVRVIARRSQFVAGDRLQKPNADWRTFGFQPKKDEGLVVAIESLLRLAFINPEEVYPDKFTSLVQPLYKAQREFVTGLFNGLNKSVKDIAKLLLETRNQKGESILEAGGKTNEAKNIKDLGVLIEKINNRGGITDEMVQKASPQAQSALETVDYFSSSYQKPLDDLIHSWNPQGNVAQNWQREMVEYIDGSWLRQVKEKFFSH